MSVKAQRKVHEGESEEDAVSKSDAAQHGKGQLTIRPRLRLPTRLPALSTQNTCYFLHAFPGFGGPLGKGHHKAKDYSSMEYRKSMHQSRLLMPSRPEARN